MRRWLSILLLVLMPFQFSWAVAAAYCEHESGVAASHFGHHEHHHQPTADESGDASKAKPGAAALDVADCHFHCACAVALPTSAGMPIIGGADRPASDAASDAMPPARSRPERPQWAGHA